MRVARTVAFVASVIAAAPLARAQNPAPDATKTGDTKVDAAQNPDDEKPATEASPAPAAAAPEPSGTGVPDTQSAAMQAYQRAASAR